MDLNHLSCSISIYLGLIIFCLSLLISLYITICQHLSITLFISIHFYQCVIEFWGHLFLLLLKHLPNIWTYIIIWFWHLLHYWWTQSWNSLFKKTKRRRKETRGTPTEGRIRKRKERANYQLQGWRNMPRYEVQRGATNLTSEKNVNYLWSVLGEDRQRRSWNPKAHLG